MFPAFCQVAAIKSITGAKRDTTEARSPDGRSRVWIENDHAYVANIAEYEQHLKAEAAAWAESARFRPDWHTARLLEAAFANDAFALRFQARQLARHAPDHARVLAAAHTLAALPASADAWTGCA